MERIAITNISTYKAIALEAHKSMCEYLEEGRRPKEDGSPGWIKTFDPDQKCFKQAMITIVFTGMWLEALLHLLIVRNHGLERFAEYDFKSYEEKLRLLGCSEQGLLDVVKRFRKSRKELVHEKAYCDDGELKTAQDEANNAHDLMVHAFFNNQPNEPLRPNPPLNSDPTGTGCFPLSWFGFLVFVYRPVAGRAG